MNRRIVLIAVAVVLALVGTVAVYSYAHNADQRAVADGRAVKVLIASKKVAAGTSWSAAVKSGDLTVQNVPASSRPDSALSGTDAGIASDAVAQGDIAPGQVVLREAFGDAASKTGVLSIPKGLIAVSVTMGADDDVAGYVVPASKVIIFATGKLELPAGAKKATTYGSDLTVTRTLIPRALVLATSNAAPNNTAAANSNAADSASSQPGGSVIVTLALNQTDAERLIMQKKLSQNSLTLGLLSDTSVVKQDGGIENSGVFHTTPIWVK